MAVQVSPELRAYHEQQVEHARQLFVVGLTPVTSAGDWQEANTEARAAVSECLSATSNLTEVARGVKTSASHVAVLRHVLAPPASQDRFKLLCPRYSKEGENKARPIPPAQADDVAAAFEVWRDRGLTRWLDEQRPPAVAELAALLAATSPLIASQRVNTVQRNRLCGGQEQRVVDLLLAKGWTRLPSVPITQLTSLPERHFMRKAKFATLQRAQEVDVACGLGGTVVCAMECKVTNDVTNSIKRVNDVLKKAKAWQDHWGSFVQTAALLQGVLKYNDVARLLGSDVRVFWSHDLARFDAWLDSPT